MTTYVPAKKGVEYIFYMGLTSQSTGQFQASATLAAGDFKVSIDGGALANLATLPAVTPAASKMVKVTLSTSEMNGDNITVIGSDAAGAEWDDVIINIQTAARQIDDLAYPTTSGRSIDVSATGEVESNLTQIDGLATNGNNATLNLKKLNIVNNDGNAFDAISEGGNGTGAYFQGHGFGYGMDILGGEDQSGLGIDNGTGTGNGAAAVVISGNENGSGVEIYSTASQGIFIEGATRGLWIQGDGGDAVYLPSTGGKSINAPNDIELSDGTFNLAAIADTVWDAALAAHQDAGSTGEALGDAGSAGDPWNTALPGAYAAGTAGKIIGDNINATVSSRSSHSAADVWAVGTRTLTSFGTLVADIWALAIETGYTAKNSMRLMLAALAGKLSGAETTTVVIRDVTDAKDRITATVDESGNRTSVTHDVS